MQKTRGKQFSPQALLVAFWSALRGKWQKGHQGSFPVTFFCKQKTHCWDWWHRYGSKLWTDTQNGPYKQFQTCSPCCWFPAATTKFQTVHRLKTHVIFKFLKAVKHFILFRTCNYMLLLTALCLLHRIFKLLWLLKQSLGISFWYLFAWSQNWEH